MRHSLDERGNRNSRGDSEIAGGTSAAAASKLREYLDDLWDKQFEEDMTAGRLDDFIGQARREHARRENPR